MARLLVICLLSCGHLASDGIRILPSTVWIVGASPQGVIWGAASLLQLQEVDEQGVYLQGACLRDYPHFEFRAASDWLLNIEINGWGSNASNCIAACRGGGASCQD